MNKEAISLYLNIYKNNRLTLFITSSILVLQPIVLIAILIVIRQMFGHLQAGYSLTSLFPRGGCLIVLYLLSSASILFVRYRIFCLTLPEIQNLRKDIAVKLYSFSRARYSQFDRKKLQTMLVQEVLRIDVLTNSIAGQFVPALLLSLCILAVLLYLNLSLTLVTAGILSLSFLIFVFTKPFFTCLIQRYHRLLERIQKQILFNLEGLNMTHECGAEHIEIEKQISVGEEFRNVTSKLSLFRDGLQLLLQMFALLASIACLLFGGWLVRQGTLSIPELVTFYAALIILKPQITTIVVCVPRILEGLESLKTLKNWLNTNDPCPRFGQKRIELQGFIEFQDVSFSYTKMALLEKINLKINRAEVVAIFGENGSGKSTITYLLLGFYKFLSGEILIDGEPIKSLDIVHLRRQIGIVPQTPFIFQGTLWDNITYGSPNAGINDVKTAAQLAQAAEFIEVLPNRYHTQIGDDGFLLSGGERQRIAIARALLNRPPVLIFDEPTNHLDLEAFDAVVKGLKQSNYQPTCLLITHDMSVSNFIDKAYLIASKNLVNYTKTIGKYSETSIAV